MNWMIPPMFAGQTVAVLASGPSMSQEVADSVRHLPRISINSTYRLAPDAEVIYATDAKWWKAHPDAMDCRGIKATVEAQQGIRPDVPASVRVLKNSGREGFDARPDHVRTLVNSGAVGIQIAVHAKAARVLLIGFDMHGGHWHGQHHAPLMNPGQHLFSRWIEYMDGLAKALPRSVEVINCTPGSALRCFPIATLDEVISIQEAA